jgi:hypothetical protein
MPLCAAAYEKAGKFREARRPAFFLSIQSFRVKGWDGKWNSRAVLNLIFNHFEGIQQLGCFNIYLNSFLVMALD